MNGQQLLQQRVSNLFPEKTVKVWKGHSHCGRFGWWYASEETEFKVHLGKTLVEANSCVEELEWLNRFNNGLTEADQGV